MMAMLIIESLEVININGKNRKRITIAHCPGPFPVGKLIEGAAVIGSGQCVVKGLMVDLVLQPLGTYAMRATW